MNVWRLKPPLSSTAGTPGAWNSSPIVSPARSGFARASTALTSCGSASRTMASWNEVPTWSSTSPDPRATRSTMLEAPATSPSTSTRAVSVAMSVTWPNRAPSSPASIT